MSDKNWQVDKLSFELLWLPHKEHIYANIIKQNKLTSS